MNFFVTVNAKRIKQGAFLIIISFFTALLYFSQATLHLPVIGSSNEPKAIYKGDNGIALTFNIGWGDVQAEPILDVLEEKKVRSATFFLSGSWAEKHPNTVKRIQDLGFEIGSLGYAYEDYTDLDDEQIRRDMLRSVESLEKVGVDEVSLLRTPTGHFDKRTIEIANRLGLTVIHWSINSQDWKNPGIDEIVKNVQKAKKGDIVLLHATDAATQTKAALPKILSTLQDKHDLVTISILIADGKVKTTLVH